jgi:hypothetical protein
MFRQQGSLAGLDVELSRAPTLIDHPAAMNFSFYIAVTARQ